jgi:hypothetical protein
LKKESKVYSLFAWLFFTTGVFAIIGSLFSWGEGWLFNQFNLSNGLIPLGDLILTAPLSLIAACGLWFKKVWGIYTGLLTSGIYIYGSLLVFISVVWNGRPYPIQLIIPPIFGLSIAIFYFIWVVKKNPMNRSK